MMSLPQPIARRSSVARLSTSSHHLNILPQHISHVPHHTATTSTGGVSNFSCNKLGVSAAAISPSSAPTVMVVSNNVDTEVTAHNEALTRQLGLVEGLDLAGHNSWRLCAAGSAAAFPYGGQQSLPTVSVLRPLENSDGPGAYASSSLQLLGLKRAASEPAFASNVVPAPKRACFGLATSPSLAPQQGCPAEQPEAEAQEPQQQQALTPVTGLRRSVWQPYSQPAKGILKRTTSPLPHALQSSASSDKLATGTDVDLVEEVDLCPAALHACDSLTLAATKLNVSQLCSLNVDTLPPVSEEGTTGADSPRGGSDMSEDTAVDPSAFGGRSASSEAAPERAHVSFARTIKVRYIPNIVQQRKRRLAAQRAATAAAAAAIAAAAAVLEHHDVSGSQQEPLTCHEQAELSSEDDEDGTYAWPPHPCPQAGGFASSLDNHAHDSMMSNGPHYVDMGGSGACELPQPCTPMTSPCGSAPADICAFDGPTLYPPKLRVKIPRRYAEAWARQQQQHHEHQQESRENCSGADDCNVASDAAAMAEDDAPATLLVTISVE